MYDLIIRDGRVIDPAHGVDDMLDVAIETDRIVALGSAMPRERAAQVLEAQGCIVTPGLIDLHVHVFEGISHYGVNADTSGLMRGVTTVIDAGSAGAQTFPGFRKYIIEGAQTRVLAYLNLSVLGMITERAGELEDLRYADTDAALRIIAANRDVIVGIKVRMEPDMVGENGHEVLRLARATAEAADLPLMIHIGNTEPPLPDILREARPGDVITHCYHNRPGGILDGAGRILPQVRQAARRGIGFDVGHGRGSFAFAVARQALAQDLPPTTISTDLHHYNVHGPVFDLATTMSKFLHLGMPLQEVIARTTAHPARVIGRPGEIGGMKPGSSADLTVLEAVEGPVMFTDASDTGRETVWGELALKPRAVVRAGKLIHIES